jgi:hypothetical protein
LPAWTKGSPQEPPTTDLLVARAELVRRFLHCYGPSTPQRFAEWTARNLRDARAAFGLVAAELVEVQVAEGSAWLLSSERRRLWRPVGAPGAVLVDGEIVGVWQARKAGSALHVRVEAFRRLPSRVNAEGDGEAERLAASRGLDSAKVEFQPSA